VSRHERRKRDPADIAGVDIILTAAQVDHVVMAVTGSDDGLRTVLFSQLGGLGKRVADVLADPSFDGLRLSRSTLVALGILASFTPAGWERSVGEVASEADVTPSTAHRYVRTGVGPVSWTVAGLSG
jgi:hypothetical protein